jgi:hypothetical protein
VRGTVSPWIEVVGGAVPANRFVDFYPHQIYLHGGTKFAGCLHRIAPGKGNKRAAEAKASLTLNQRGIRASRRRARGEGEEAAGSAQAG